MFLRFQGRTFQFERLTASFHVGRVNFHLDAVAGRQLAQLKIRLRRGYVQHDASGRRIYHLQPKALLQPAVEALPAAHLQRDRRHVANCAIVRRIRGSYLGAGDKQK